MNSRDLYKMLHCKDHMEIFSANFLETKRLSLMNSGDLYKMLHCKHYMKTTGAKSDCLKARPVAEEEPESCGQIKTCKLIFRN